jgi:hypothetical protein
MSPEERADALADWLLDHGRVPIMTRDSRARIASAIRDAEDAAYELAALFCDEEAKLKESAVFADRAFGRREAGRRMGRMIRALKSKGT